MNNQLLLWLGRLSNLSGSSVTHHTDTHVFSTHLFIFIFTFWLGKSFCSHHILGCNTSTSQWVLGNIKIPAMLRTMVGAWELLICSLFSACAVVKPNLPCLWSPWSWSQWQGLRWEGWRCACICSPALAPSPDQIVSSQGDSLQHRRNIAWSSGKIGGKTSQQLR